ncbi:MAG: hypothetical protein SFU91_04805 [Chloroherpetonaceae bacterium]|nr:hypothetical protein [Chloroherpetonaceae bacterium]
MGNKLVPKIILEGTRLTFKTDIAFKLNEHPEVTGKRKYRYHNPVVSGEWCGFTNTPWGRGLINFNPDEEAKAIATYNTWVTLFEQLRYYSWIVDRFHLSTAMFQFLQHQRELDFQWLEERLSRLNFRLIFLTRTAESFEAARKERLKVSGNPKQYDDLTRFVREQEVLTQLVKNSKLQSLTVDISDNNLERAVESIAAWMKDTGGLTLEDLPEDLFIGNSKYSC